MIIKSTNPGIITKEFKFDIKADHKPDDDGMYRFEAYGSTFGNVDLDDDVMVKGCFTESLRTLTPIILWQHDRYEPIGMPESIVEDSKGLKLKVAMPADDTFVSGRVMPQLRIKSITTMSIGFRILDYHIKEGIRYITKAMLREVSLVTFAANPQAQVTSVKSLDGNLKFAPRNQAWNEKEATSRLLELHKCAANFMHIKADKSPVMPFTDVINGTVLVIPRALFAIKLALALQDNTLNLQDTEKQRITALTDLYIEKLNEEQPIIMLSVTDTKKLSKKELEAVLRDSGAFSKDASVIVASGFQEAGDPPNDDEATLKAIDDILGQSKDAALLAEIENLSKKF